MMADNYSTLSEGQNIFLIPYSTIIGPSRKVLFAGIPGFFQQIETQRWP